MGWLKELLTGSKPKVQPLSVNDENFEQEVLRAELPVVLDVWGPGCTPCKQLEPIIMDLARRYEGRIRVAEVNAQAAPRTMARLGVRTTPTVIYYRRGGEEAERVVGFKGSLWHQQTVEELLLDGPEEVPPAVAAGKEQPGGTRS